MKIFLAVVIVLALLLVIPTACTRPEEARRILAEQGYADVEIDGYGWLRCDDKDMFSTLFAATAPSGKRVHGVVCSGLLKGGTVRFF